MGTRWMAIFAIACGASSVQQREEAPQPEPAPARPLMEIASACASGDTTACSEYLHAAPVPVTNIEAERATAIGVLYEAGVRVELTDDDDVVDMVIEDRECV